MGIHLVCSIKPIIAHFIIFIYVNVFFDPKNLIFIKFENLSLYALETFPITSIENQF